MLLVTRVAQQQKVQSSDPVDIDRPPFTQPDSQFNGLIPLPHLIDFAVMFTLCRLSGT
jgi:hypothetical protein